MQKYDFETEKKGERKRTKKIKRWVMTLKDTIIVKTF